MKINFIAIFAAALCLSACGTNEAPAPFGALPSEDQLNWQRMETIMFCHFGPNTFTTAEWGSGKESEDVFNPTDLDCNQWAAIAKAAGFKGMILTAKHHDGFCLWPNSESVHTVAQSSWRDGKGDVLREFSDACRANGVKYGVYISPWDRNHPTYGTDEYNKVFSKALEQVYSDYGDIFEMWLDGACGEGPNGKVQVYDWDMIEEVIHRMEPHAVVNGGPHYTIRWGGNESGWIEKTNWCTAFEFDDIWMPSESDVSIRPGWFWKESETPRVKTLDQLLTIWYNTVGRNSVLLLNVPPDNRGLFDPVDSTRLMEFRAALDEIQSVNLADGAKIKASDVRGRNFKTANMLDSDPDTYWATSDSVKSAVLEISLPEARSFNRLMLQEYLQLGQRVEKFSVEIPEGDSWKKIADETTIGYKRIVILPDVTASKLKINIESSAACPTISTIALYQDNILDYKDNTPNNL